MLIDIQTCHKETYEISGLFNKILTSGFFSDKLT